MPDQSESDKRGPVKSEFRPLADPPFVPPVAPPDPQPLGYSPAEQMGLDAGSVERREDKIASEREQEANHPWMPRRRLTDAQIRLAYDMERVSEALAGGHALPPLHTLPGKNDDERIELFIKSQREEHDARVKDAKRVHADIEARKKEQAERDEAARKDAEAKTAQADSEQRDDGRPVHQMEIDALREADARTKGKDRAGIKPAMQPSPQMVGDPSNGHEPGGITGLKPDPQRVSPGDDKRWQPERVSTDIVQPQTMVDPYSNKERELADAERHDAPVGP